MHAHKHVCKTLTSLQVAAGQEGAGQAGPEGTRGDCGQFHFLQIWFYLNVDIFSIGEVLRDLAAASQYVSR